MSFSRMKPLPKAIILLAIVAVVGYGVKFGLDSMPKKPPPEVATTTPVPAEGAAPPPVAAPPATALQNANSAVQAATQAAQAAPAPAPAPAAPAQGLTPAGGHDAGLANVFKK